MEIEQYIWGMTPEGEAIVLYTMRNASGAELRLCNYGAAIVGLTLPDRTGHLDDVVLGYKRYDGYIGDPALCGKIAGRCAGRIAWGRMEIDGTEYRLDANDCGSHRYGGTHGFGTRVWEGRVETNRVVMSLLSEEGDQGYPGTLGVEVVFDFDDEQTLEITYLARTDRTTVVDLSHRLYLNLAGEASGDALDHELQLAANRYVATDDRQIPTGALTAAAGTPLDFTTYRRLRDGIASDYDLLRMLRGYDHTFVIDNWQPHILGVAGSLRDPKSGRSVEVLTSQPCLTLYTGNRLAGGCPETKSGGRYVDHAGLVLECGGYPDAVNRPEFPSTRLEPGALYCEKTVYRFSTC